ncbi:Sec-independent protein translocase subunit TatA [Actinomadura verrucosospora]|uniref:Sec-independent protein translocase protein TatA n=1 Tax=Actinomadura verrucosospora TaxID=46165 RepID=A0A7D3ZIZ7_ACTVE|nr:Sec-independent protein translocase subunit TatA [Actinomadura verrucosospora]QKG20801.1 preprotein translocase subunit TatA [Actinomadura verrucosospora]
MLGEFSPSHWLIVAIVVVLLFGSKKLPDAARAIGRSMRILKSETQGLHDDPAPAPAAEAIPPAAPDDARDKLDRAARLREEAARIESAASTAPAASTASTGKSA